MNKNRVEAFSDGVIAILITIMVLELRPPHEPTWAALAGLRSVFLSYVMSFVFLAIYWNNHHHLMQVVRHVNGRVLWANTNVLFWLSLTPFVTAWMGDSHFAPVPVAAYGVVLLMAGVSYYVLIQLLLPIHGPDSPLARAVGSDAKGRLSVLIYAAAIPIAFVKPLISCLLYFTVMVIWFVPDKRMERVLSSG